MVAIQEPTVASPVKKSPKRSASGSAPAPTPAAPQSTQSAQAAANPPFSAPPTATLIPGAPGTLIVVDDAFVPVTVLTERDIEATRGATITEVLQTKPGIVGSTFTAGANRPIVRGLDNYRVRVQENGLGSADVSALSEDHLVPIDPHAASQIEVIRGPATLRYGSQAIGGVVAVENDRIPTAVPERGFSGQIRGGLSSVDEGHEGSFRATAGANGVVVTGDGFRREAEDYDTPRGEQFNSFAESEGGAVGISLVGPSGYLGVSFSRFESKYGITGGDEAEEATPFIDLEQDKVQVKGEWRVKNYGLEALRFWFGATDYEHTENANEEEGFEVTQLFTNEEYEGRFEAQHSPFRTSMGTLRGAFGLQAFNRETEARFLEDGDSLLAPAETDSIAAFLFEELDVTRQLTLQSAVRVEHTEVDGVERQAVTINVDDSQLLARSRDFTLFSASVGGLYRLPGEHVVSLNGQYVERAPDAAELFSGGVHEATATFEIGDANLDIEKAFSIEGGLRKATGAFRYDATAFYTKYDGFIFKSLSGETCGEIIGSCEVFGGNGGVDEQLDQVLFAQRDARFFGVELAAQYDVSPLWRGVWGVDGQYDFVNAEFTNGENVPRISPHRLGGGLYYRDINWFARAGVLHAFEQDQVAPEEAEEFGTTPGYTLVSAELSY
ncbi:MAG: TonB-dependent receptor, partial [Myxococcota bacterium]